MGCRIDASGETDFLCVGCTTVYIKIVPSSGCSLVLEMWHQKESAPTKNGTLPGLIGYCIADNWVQVLGKSYVCVPTLLDLVLNIQQPDNHLKKYKGKLAIYQGGL